MFTNFKKSAEVEILGSKKQICPGKTGHSGPSVTVIKWLFIVLIMF